MHRVHVLRGDLPRACRRVAGVSHDAHDALRELVARGEERDNVPVTLAHLLPVGAGHHRDVRHDIWLGEREDIRFEDAVEFLRRVACYLDVLFLVSSHRHDSGVVEQDVGGHQHRVVEGPDVDLPILRLSIFESVSAHEVRHRGDCVEYPTELGVCRHIRLFEKGNFLWVEADGEICHHDFLCAPPHLLGILYRVQRVVVGDEDKGAVLPAFGELDELTHRAEVVADMQVASRLHAGDEDRFRISHCCTISHLDSPMQSGKLRRERRAHNRLPTIL